MIYTKSLNAIILSAKACNSCTIYIVLLNGNEIIYNKTVNAIPLNAKACNSCTIYILLFVIFLISMSISSVFIYFH